MLHCLNLLYFSVSIVSKHKQTARADTDIHFLWQGLQYFIKLLKAINIRKNKFSVCSEEVLCVCIQFVSLPLICNVASCYHPLAALNFTRRSPRKDKLSKHISKPSRNSGNQELFGGPGLLAALTFLCDWLRCKILYMTALFLNVHYICWTRASSVRRAHLEGVAVFYEVSALATERARTSQPDRIFLYGVWPCDPVRLGMWPYSVNWNRKMHERCLPLGCM